MSTVRVTQTRSDRADARARGHAALRSGSAGSAGAPSTSRRRALEGKLRHVAHLVSVTPLDAKDATGTSWQTSSTSIR